MSATPIKVEILTESGKKTAEVSFPTDQQWKKRRRAMAPITRSLGRGQSEMVPAAYEDVDHEIYNAIKSEGSPELDQFEASKVIERLAFCRLDSLKCEGANIKLALKTLYGVKAFVFRMPSLRQQTEYKRGIVKLRDLPNNAQKAIINMDVAATMFDELLVDGDKEGLSILYKAEASSQVMSEVFRQDEVGEDDDF